MISNAAWGLWISDMVEIYTYPFKQFNIHFNIQGEVLYFWFGDKQNLTNRRVNTAMYNSIDTDVEV